MVMQRQVPAGGAGKSPDFGLSSKAGGDGAKEPFAEVLSGQQRAATAKPGRAETNRDDTTAAEPEDLDGVQSGIETRDPIEPTGDADDVLTLLNDLMSSAAYGNDAGVGASGEPEPAAQGDADVVLSGAPDRKLTDASAPREPVVASARTGPDPTTLQVKTVQADGVRTATAELPPVPTGPATRNGPAAAPTQVPSQVLDAGRGSATAAAIAQPAAAIAKPAIEPAPRERAKPAEAKETLRALGLAGQLSEGRDATRATKADQHEAGPVVRTATATSRQREQKLENSPRNVEVLDARRFVALQPLGGNAQMLARSIMDAGDAAQAIARTAPPPTSAIAGQQPPGQTLHTLKLQLNPVSLGSVTAVLKLSGEELRVDIKVETAEAYRQLSDDNQALLKSLRSQGYGVEQINIQHVTGGDRAQVQQTGAQPGFQGPGSNDAQGSDRGGDGRNRSGRSGGDNGGQSREPSSHPASGPGGRTDGVYL